MTSPKPSREACGDCPHYREDRWENIISMVERQHICKCDGPCPQHVDCLKRQQILQEEQQ